MRIDDAIRSRFREAGVQAEFFTEYLDLSWSIEPQFVDNLRVFLKAKHGQRKFDVVIPAGSGALRFALAHRAELFPGVPIVFCAATSEGTADIRLAQGVTGVWMEWDAATTVAVAMRLQPRARRLVTVSGASALDNVFLQDVMRSLARGRIALEVSHLRGLPLDEVRAALSRLPRETIILYVSMLRDGAGRVFVPAEALELIAPASAAPIYGLADLLVGRGIVGGHVFSFGAQGARAADMAIRLFSGEPIERIATVGHMANEFQFDWRALRRWGLRDQDLPRGSIVLNRVPSAWEVYHWHILALAALVVAETGLIGTLFAQRRRRRRADADLERRLHFQTLVSELSSALADLPDADVDRGIEEGLPRIGEHLGLDRATILRISRDGRRILVTHAWYAAGVEPFPSSVETVRFPWGADRLRRGEVIRFSRLDELPTDAAIDRETFASLGVSAGISVPLGSYEGVIGAISGTRPPSAVGWGDDVVDQLKLVGGIFAGALLRRHGEVELQKLRGELLHASRVSTMGELAASLAHELTQPLTAILSNAEVATQLLDLDVEDQKELREILSDIVADDQRAGEVIRRLQAFLKKERTHRVVLDLNSVVHDVWSLVRSDAIIRSASVTLDLAPDLPPVLADRIQLQQVILNIVMNGLDAMHAAADQRLVVTTRVVDETTVKVAVSDRGGGIPERDLGRVFEPFYTTKPHGFGMGLSIARTLIEGHGGRIQAENNAEGGATFSFTLPLSDDDRT